MPSRWRARSRGLGCSFSHSTSHNLDFLCYATFLLSNLRTLRSIISTSCDSKCRSHNEGFAFSPNVYWPRNLLFKQDQNFMTRRPFKWLSMYISGRSGVFSKGTVLTYDLTPWDATTFIISSTSDLLATPEHLTMISFPIRSNDPKWKPSPGTPRGTQIPWGRSVFSDHSIAWTLSVQTTMPASPPLPDHSTIFSPAFSSL